jgi:hypothetical protein
MSRVERESTLCSGITHPSSKSKTTIQTIQEYTSTINTNENTQITIETTTSIHSSTRIQQYENTDTKQPVTNINIATKTSRIYFPTNEQTTLDQNTRNPEVSTQSQTVNTEVEKTVDISYLISNIVESIVTETTPILVSTNRPPTRCVPVQNQEKGDCHKQKIKDTKRKRTSTPYTN